MCAWPTRTSSSDLWGQQHTCALPEEEQQRVRESEGKRKTSKRPRLRCSSILGFQWAFLTMTETKRLKTMQQHWGVGHILLYTTANVGCVVLVSERHALSLSSQINTFSFFVFFSLLKIWILIGLLYHLMN